MRWFVFAIAAYVLLVLQVGLAPHLVIETRWGAVEPQFVLILAVFVSLSATAQVAGIACGVLGMLLDIASTYLLSAADPASGLATHQTLTLIGPQTLGYLAGSYLIIQLRPMVFRQHPLTFATMLFAAGFAVLIVVLGIFSIRRWYEPMPGFSAMAELISGLLGLLYTGVLGVVILIPLRGMMPLFSFVSAKPARRG